MLGSVLSSCVERTSQSVYLGRANHLFLRPACNRTGVRDSIEQEAVYFTVDRLVRALAALARGGGGAASRRVGIHLLGFRQFVT